MWGNVVTGTVMSGANRIGRDLATRFAVIFTTNPDALVSLELQEPAKPDQRVYRSSRRMNMIGRVRHPAKPVAKFLRHTVQCHRLVLQQFLEGLGETSSATPAEGRFDPSEVACNRGIV
jgi:hypothetical protein